MSLREKLTNHLRQGHGFISSGDLQRMEWKDSHGALATPSNISRRLKELEVDGVLEFQGPRTLLAGAESPDALPIKHNKTPLQTLQGAIGIFLLEITAKSISAKCS